MNDPDSKRPAIVPAKPPNSAPVSGRPDRHAAITTELFTFLRYKAWEDKIKKQSTVKK